MHLPSPAPLRDRIEDIPALAAQYFALFAAKTNKKIRGISKDSLELLEKHTWKGNIRELKNIIERAVILESGEQLSIDRLPLDIQSAPESNASAFDLSSVEKLHIQRCSSWPEATKPKRPGC